MPVAPQADTDSVEFPHWRVNKRALAVGTFLNTMGFTISFPFLALIVQELGVSGHLETWTGLVAGSYFTVSFLLAPVWGAFADHYGRRSMVLRAGLGMGITFAAASLAGSMTVFLPLFLVAGAWNGYVPAAIALVATSTPRQHLGRALASIQSAALLGVTAGPAVGAVLAHILPAYRGLFGVSAVLSLSAGAVALFFAREQHTRPTTAFRLHVLRDSATILRVPRMWLLLGMNFLFSTAIFGSATVMALYVLELAGATPAPVLGWQLGLESWVGIVTIALTISSALAAPVWGRWLDRFDPARILAFSLGAATLASWLFPFVQDPLQLTLARVVLGLCAAGMSAGTVTLIKAWAPPGMDARSLALGTALAMLGNGAAPLMAGFIGPVFGLRAYFAVVAVLLLAGLALWSTQGLRRRGAPTP